MLSALVTVNENCVSELTQRQGNELMQFTIVPGVPIVRSELGSSSRSGEVGSGSGAGSVFAISDDVLVLPEVSVSEIGTMLDPTPRFVLSSAVVVEVSVEVSVAVAVAAAVLLSVVFVAVVVPGVTSLMIVSVQALSNKQLVRTTNPLMCSLYTRLSLMKYVLLSTFF
jgi:hypothetical protein